MNDIIILNNINITPLIHSSLRLDEGLKEPKSIFLRDACIQRFEIAFELAWKTMKRILSDRGLHENSPRMVLRAACNEKLIDEIEPWFTFLEYRNKTVHTYNESLADEIYSSLNEFCTLLNTFTALIQSEQFNAN